MDLGEGGAATLRRGLLFPVSDGSVGVGWVWVGAATLDLPVGGADDVLAVTGVPVDGGRWPLPVDLVVTLGLGENVAAGTAAGQAIADDPKNVIVRDAEGREVVVVTDLNPRRALDDARDALRKRSQLLAEAGLDPAAMFAREAWRSGPRRTLAEGRPTADLRPLVGAADPQADIVAPWATWVADPTGLVDERFAGVLGVHGPTVDGRIWRAVTGAAHHGPPAWTTTRGVVNATTARATGVTQVGEMVAQLTITAGETGRLLDVWVPEVTDVAPGRLTTDDRVDVVAGGPSGGTFGAVDAPFGPRRRAGARLRSWLLPEPVAAGAQTTVRFDWTEEWDVSGAFDAAAFADWAWMGPEKDQPGVAFDGTTLGKVAVGIDLFPRLATGPADYPCELRAGTNVPGWTVVVPAGAGSVGQDNGTLWVWKSSQPALVSVGRFQQLTSAARPGLPAIRVERHSPIEEDLLVGIRGILNFYADGFGRWPWPEVVVVQGRARPVLLADNLGFVRPEADPRWVTGGFRYVGGGVLEYARVLPLGAVDNNHALDPVPSPVRKKKREDSKGRSGHATRSLALALAEGFWGPVTFGPADGWLSGAIPRLYRDEFVLEAWGPEIAAGWDAFTDEAVAAAEPAGAAPLEGRTEPWAAERGARLLRLVRAKIGEEATFRALEGLRTGPAEAWNLDGLVAAFEAEGGSFGELFRTFAHGGVRPRVTAAVGGDGALAVATDPPVGGFELPIRVGKEWRWVQLVAGEGRLDLDGEREVEVDPEGWLPLRRSPPVTAKRGRRER